MRIRNAIMSSVVFIIALLLVFVVINPRIREKHALFAAAEGNDLEQVKVLLQKGSPINEVNKTDFGFTPLIVAIYHDNEGVANFLIDSGADVNIPSTDGATPLMWATRLGDTAFPLVTNLLAHGANANAKDKTGSTAYDYAKAVGQTPQLIELFQSRKQLSCFCWGNERVDPIIVTERNWNPGFGLVRKDVAELKRLLLAGTIQLDHKKSRKSNEPATAGAAS
jgi:ankyrin repeat protein